VFAQYDASSTIWVDREMPATYQGNDLDDCVGRILESCAGQVVLAVPLGLGKPNHLINGLYRRIAADPSCRLTIHTALSLAVPRPSSELERRFAGPFLQRQFGSDYTGLDYVDAMRRDALPANIRVHEFYFQSGAMLGSRQAQRDYVSLNYTYVARDLVGAGINVIAQLVAKRDHGAGACYSLGCNPDVTLDLVDRMREAGVKRPLFVGVVHDELPFLGGDADVGNGQDLFDIVLSTPESRQRLFALPRKDVDDVDYAIGLHASTLVRDGGTLQIGIGALSDALVHALILRQKRNAEYQNAIVALRHGSLLAAESDYIGGQDPLERGLHGSSEMVMDGFMHLRRNGILSRNVYRNLALQEALDADVIQEVFRPGDLHRLRAAGVFSNRPDRTELSRMIALGILDEDAVLKDGCLVFADGTRVENDLDDPDSLEILDRRVRGRRLRGGCYLQGGFCLGSSVFYDWLANLEGEDYSGLEMSRISEVNLLHRGEETLAAAQRRRARFFNTCMIATALGASAADAVEDGRIVSGVGGQYNFVSMSYALDDARSVLMLRSTRESNGEWSSNIRWNYGHTTIPRHLRDVYVSEYGIADLRGRTDEECVCSMIAISDARFQQALVDDAIRAKKLPAGFAIPQSWKANTPAGLRSRLGSSRASGMLPDYPFGSDFDETELRLIKGLGWLKAASSSPASWCRLLQAVARPGATDAKALARMGLDHPRSFKERVLARLVAGSLNRISPAAAV
jgi:acyl-CoA hydrolase